MPLKQSVKSQYSVYPQTFYETDNLKHQHISGSNVEQTQVNGTHSNHRQEITVRCYTNLEGIEWFIHADWHRDL